MNATITTNKVENTEKPSGFPQGLDMLSLVFHLLAESSLEHTKIALTTERQMVENNNTLDSLNRRLESVAPAELPSALYNSIMTSKDSATLSANNEKLSALQIQIQQNDAYRQGIQNTMTTERQKGQIDSTEQNTSSQETAQSEQTATACSKGNLTVVQSLFR